MIAANRGATPGWLVPLSAGLCYIGKPGRFLPSSSISKVLFHRAGGGSSTFDITIKPVKAAAGAGVGGGVSSKVLELGQIDAGELVKLQGYLSTHRIKVRSLGFYHYAWFRKVLKFWINSAVCTGSSCSMLAFTAGHSMHVE
jgi:hypothetical protein